MTESASNLPVGNLNGTVVHSTTELGELIRQRRRALQLNQLDIAGLGNTGNRFLASGAKTLAGRVQLFVASTTRQTIKRLLQAA
ncbi:hypothetical protein SAMN05444679_109132 [Variovorax sp. CF079]|uniref:hypothetical protein n=1 Tax=Variovorax sp. CF079 TaxID=1882774 RepID=UPI00088A31D3|nr:hypothetical protein [Variovorax sp. CF079]SDD29769.1 hypothetical protein SAMN05444679_109132 [Variovorax sp. CF079]